MPMKVNPEHLKTNILSQPDISVEIDDLSSENRHKYVPPFEFATGKLPRLQHKKGLVNNVAAKNVYTTLDGVVSGETSTEDVEIAISILAEELRIFYRDALLDNRFDKTFKKSTIQLVVDLHKNDKKSLEELLEGSQITPGFYVTKLGDEIALLYEIDGKLIITFTFPVFLILIIFSSFNKLPLVYKSI